MYDVDSGVKVKSDRINTLCSTAGELIGDLHIRTLKPLLADERLVIVDDFGHRCSGPGMTHLFNILDSLSN